MAMMGNTTPHNPETKSEEKESGVPILQGCVPVIRQALPPQISTTFQKDTYLWLGELNEEGDVLLCSVSSGKVCVGQLNIFNHNVQVHE